MTPVYFDSPPVSEVVVATYFKPALDLRTEHAGVYWSQIKGEFPLTRQQPPVGAEMLGGADVFPMPRYWFIAEDGGSLIQVQKNAFMYNWRRQDDVYPRYRSIKPDFDKQYTRFMDFVRTEVSSVEPAIGLCELTYVNSVRQCEYWQGPQDTKKVIPSFSMLLDDSDRWSSAGFESNFAFRIKNTMHLQVSIRSGIATQEPHVPILIFEIKAAEQVASIRKSEADDWFDCAHGVIMDCFLDMTSQRVQTEQWKRKYPPYE